MDGTTIREAALFAATPAALTRGVTLVGPISHLEGSRASHSLACPCHDEICAPAGRGCTFVTGRVPIDLAAFGNRDMQEAVRRNLVCFPSQVPVFGRRPRRDLQWRLAVLYFVRGWSTGVIARRYGLTRERCCQIISDWRMRAVNMGYIQDVTPED